jgi:hypothetical protein
MAGSNVQPFFDEENGNVPLGTVDLPKRIFSINFKRNWINFTMSIRVIYS